MITSITILDLGEAITISAMHGGEHKKVTFTEPRQVHLVREVSLLILEKMPKAPEPPRTFHSRE